MNDLNNIAFDINSIAMKEEGVMYLLKNVKIDERDLLSILSKDGKKVYKKLKNRI